jgi:hypothetical protein
MARRTPPRKVRYFEPVARASRATRSSCRRSRSAAVTHARCASIAASSTLLRSSGPDRRDAEGLADWRAGRDALYQLAALTIGARLAIADI